MPVADILLVNFYFKHPPQLAINRHYLRIQAIEGVERTLSQIPNDLFTSLAPLYASIMPTAASIAGVGCRRVWPGPETTELFSTFPAMAGSIAGDPLATQTAGVITWRTPLAGRANRGRSYIPFPAEPHNDTTGLPTNGYTQGLNDLGNTIAPALVSPIALPNRHTYVKVIYRAATPATSPGITSHFARTKWGTQRRRGSYGQPNISPVNP